MHYYDLDLAAWVRKPGSSAPPMEPAVFVVDGIDEFAMQLCKGAEIVNPGASAWLTGLKVAGTPNAGYLASDDAPIGSGNGVTEFVFDLTTEQAATPFSDGATTQVRCIVQVSWVDSGGNHRITAPLECFLKASYLTETTPMFSNTLEILAAPDLTDLPPVGRIQIYYDIATGNIKARDHDGNKVILDATDRNGNVSSSLGQNSIQITPTAIVVTTPANFGDYPYVLTPPAASGTITVH